MRIAATDVKALREKTGAGMMDCKNALVKAEGDFAKAEKILKELGLMAASKRMDRPTNEGRVFSLIRDGKGALLELSCETDFVARNQDFNDLGKRLAEKIIADELDEPNEELRSMVEEVMTRIKENMSLRRFATIRAEDSETLIDYIHGEGRIGVIVKVKVGEPALKSNQRLGEVAFDFALHVAAFAPRFLTRDAVDADYVAEQEALFRKQTESMDKPDKVKEGIAKGKLNKHLSEITLMEQGFVREEKKKCSAVLASLAKELGTTVTISDFLYYKVGGEIPAHGS